MRSLSQLFRRCFPMLVTLLIGSVSVAHATNDFSMSSATVTEGDSGNTVLTVTVTRSNPSGNSTLYFDETSNGVGSNPATVGVDFLDPSASYTYRGTTTTHDFSITIVGDTTPEADERIRISLGCSFGSNCNVERSFTITNDDGTNLTIGNVSHTEGSAGTTTDASFTVTSQYAVSGGFSADVATSDGTATTGDTDYITTLSTLNFTGTAGETKTVPVTIRGDDVTEAEETFTLGISGLTGAPANSAFSDTGTGTITNDDTATLAIDDVVANEGDSGEVDLNFRVTLNGEVDTSFTVDFATQDGSATTANNDYDFKSGTLNFTGSDGQVRVLTIKGNGDTVAELDEALNVVLTNISSSGGDPTFSDDTGSGTLTNDDFTQVSIGDAVVTEGDSGTTTLSFQVTSSADDVGGFSIDFSTADGTATSASGDYTASAGTLNFSGTAGEIQTVTVTVAGDTQGEEDEGLTVQLSNLSGATAGASILDATGAGTITNDDGTDLSISDAVVTEGDSGTTTLRFTVTSPTADPGGFTVDWASADGTATTADGDYSAGGSTLTFAGTAGETQTVTVSVTGDTQGEDDEALTVSLSNLAGALSPATLADATGTGTITNDDGTALTIMDAAVAEGDSGTTTLSFTLTSPTADPGGFSVDYATSDGTASVADGDYSAGSGTVVFAGTAGETQVVTVTIQGDTRGEDNEALTVTLSNLTGALSPAIIADSSATGTITNDDGTGLTISDATVIEGDSGTASLTFTVTSPTEDPGGFNVDWASSDGTATTADGDYTAGSATLTFAGTVGETHSITIAVNGDSRGEDDEGLIVTLSNLTGALAPATILDASGAGTIINDDGTMLSIADAVVTEGDSGTVTLAFVVTSTNSDPGGFTVDYSTLDGTATTTDSDYIAATGSLDFTGTAGETQTAAITVNGDTIVEVDEHLQVQISNLVGALAPATISDPTGDGTITNDDGTAVTIADATIAEGDSGTTTLTFVVTSSGSDPGGFTVDYTTADGSATVADSDYLTGNGTLVFAGAAGETQHIQVTLTGDTIVELDEGFSVQLSNLSGASPLSSITDATGSGTVTNDDTATFSIANDAGPEGHTGITPVSFSVTLDAAVDTSITLLVASADGSATAADGDYLANSETLTFAGTAGETQVFVVQAMGDTQVELDESFTVSPSSLNASGRAVALPAAGNTATLLNDDTASLSIADALVTEGAAGTTKLDFLVTLNAAVDAGVTVAFISADGTATIADGDYVAAASSAAFSGTAGEVRTISVQVQGDGVVERDETLLVNLGAIASGGRSVGLANAQAQGTITNDDLATVSIGDVTQAEAASAFLFPVTLDAPVDVAVTVDVSPTDLRSALPGIDFLVASTPITFPPGTAVTQLVVVQVLDDSEIEATETFGVVASNLQASGRNVTAGPSGTGAILDSDTASGDPRDADDDDRPASVDHDRDGDGIDNSLDPAPDDRTVGGVNLRADHLGLLVDHLTLRLRHDVHGRDRLRVRGVFPLPRTFALPGSTVTAELLGETRVFTVDSNGEAVSGDAILRIRGKPGVSGPGDFPARFELLLRNADLSPRDLSAALLPVNSAATSRTVELRLVLDDGATPVEQRYNVKSLHYRSDGLVGTGAALRQP